jgi:hypothetical protein
MHHLARAGHPPLPAATTCRRPCRRRTSCRGSSLRRRCREAHGGAVGVVGAEGPGARGLG